MCKYCYTVGIFCIFSTSFYGKGRVKASMKGKTVKDQGFSFRGKCLSDIIMLLVFLVNKKTLPQNEGYDWHVLGTQFVSSGAVNGAVLA